MVPCQEPIKASVIWLHGLGANGNDFLDVVHALNLSEKGVRFILPHAPIRPVTINNGMRMRAWYDVQSMEMDRQEDKNGLDESLKLVKQWIDKELALGIHHSQIILAGFSQGAAVSLHSALRLDCKLAGVIALSGYLPSLQYAESESLAANRSTPLFMAHGDFDPIIPIGLAQMSREYLKTYFKLQWQTYPMDHSVSPEEIIAIRNWLQETLNLNPA